MWKWGTLCCESYYVVCLQGGASTGNPAYPAQGLLNPYPAWPRLPVRCLHAIIMPKIVSIPCVSSLMVIRSPWSGITRCFQEVLLCCENFLQFRRIHHNRLIWQRISGWSYFQEKTSHSQWVRTTRNIRDVRQIISCISIFYSTEWLHAKKSPYRCPRSSASHYCRRLGFLRLRYAFR